MVELCSEFHGLGFRQVVDRGLAEFGVVVDVDSVVEFGWHGCGGWIEMLQLVFSHKYGVLVGQVPEIGMPTLYFLVYFVSDRGGSA